MAASCGRSLAANQSDSVILPKPAQSWHTRAPWHPGSRSSSGRNTMPWLPDIRICGMPAILMSGSHGMVFRPDDERLPGCQGALVCQDWAGFGKITESDWFAASDLPQDAAIHGMIHFLFACYGGG